MSGELWNEVVQYGREATYGVAVAATRKAYLRDVAISRERAPRPQEFATGTRHQVRDFTLGPVVVGGGFKLPVSADELIEWALVTGQGAVTPTTPSGATLARLWTFLFGSTALDSMTLERNDGAVAKRAIGVYGDTMEVAGSANGENLATFGLFGKDYLNNALTGSLTDRVPTFMEGWQTRVYIDSFGGTPGFTRIVGQVINHKLNYNNNLKRKYFYDNVNTLGAARLGKIALTCGLTLDAVGAQAASELTNWDTPTKRLLRLEFLGPANEIEAGANEVQTLTMTGTPTGGTFTLSFGGQTTAAIAYNASAAAVQAALELLTNIGSGNVLGAGGALPGTPVTITFQGALAATDVPLMTANSASLTGGSTPTMTPTTTTAGRSGRRYVIFDLPLAWSAFSLNDADEESRAYGLTGQYVYDPTNSFAMRMLIQNARTAAFA